jgi:hypothetical protein
MADDNPAGTASLQDGGCWFCRRRTDGIAFSTEVGAHFHEVCLYQHLAEIPDDVEVLRIAREHVTKRLANPAPPQKRVSWIKAGAAVQGIGGEDFPTEDDEASAQPAPDAVRGGDGQ